MMDRHSRKAVTSRLRLRDHDYASSTSYFITICTARRVCLFGDIHESQMRLSPAGQMIDSWLGSIVRRFPTVMLDEAIVMPNHLHAIVMIGTETSLDRDQTLPALSDIIHWFKTKTTNDYGLGVRNQGWDRYSGKLWQSGFYDHIIRNDTSLQRIRTYILANTSQWRNDGNNPLKAT